MFHGTDPAPTTISTMSDWSVDASPQTCASERGARPVAVGPICRRPGPPRVLPGKLVLAS